MYMKMGIFTFIHTNENQCGLTLLMLKMTLWMPVQNAYPCGLTGTPNLAVIPYHTVFPDLEMECNGLDPRQSEFRFACRLVWVYPV